MLWLSLASFHLTRVNATSTSPAFEIKVAIIGNVSAGKTTVMNALFRDKYGEVSMKRTTAGVNEFAIVDQHHQQKTVRPKSILHEITRDNLELRASDEVHTKRFDIVLEEPLVVLDKMRKDTQLVIVDIPGINEAHASQKYKDYVEIHWKTFDAVVVVMDGRQGVNTECQVSLLQFVKANLHKKKKVPVVILFNKIDDPDDEEQAELVLEAQREVEKIFEVEDRQKSLNKLLDDEHAGVVSEQHEISSATTVNQTDLSPVFIPISGITAFIFQTCSNMSLERFREFDEQLIAKIGRERIGKQKWKRLSKEEQLEHAHKAISDPEGYLDGLEDSNFDKFLKVFSFLVGGESVQDKLIQSQIQVSIDGLSCGNGLVQELEEVCKKILAFSNDESQIQESVSSLQAVFWLECYELQDELSETDADAEASEVFVALASEFVQYKHLASTLGWKDEIDKSIESFTNLIHDFLRQIGSSPGFVDHLELVHNATREMSQESLYDTVGTQLRDTFATLFALLLAKTYVLGPETIYHYSVLADELIHFSNLSKDAGWKNEEDIYETFEDLVRWQIGRLCESASKSLEQSAEEKSWTTFESLSPMNWNRLLRSMMLLRSETHFAMTFGREIVWMEYLTDAMFVASMPDFASFSSPSLTDWRRFQRHYTLELDFEFASGFKVGGVPGYMQSILEIPDSVLDKNHVGHFAWRFIEFAKREGIQRFASSG